MSKKTYTLLAAAAGVEALEATEDGVHLDTSLADAIENHLVELNNKVSSVELPEGQTVASMLEQINALTSERDQAIEAKATAESTVADLNAKIEELEKTPPADATSTNHAGSNEGGENQKTGDTEADYFYQLSQIN